MRSQPSAKLRSAALLYLMDLKKIGDVKAFEKFSNYAKTATVTIEELTAIYAMEPRFAHKLVKTIPQLIKTKQDLFALIKLDPMLAFTLLPHLHGFLSDSLLADFCNRYVRAFRDDFLQKTLLDFPVTVLKRLLKTRLGTYILMLFPPTTAQGKLLAQCPEITFAINTPAALEALEKANKKSKQQPTMAHTLLDYHPRIVMMKLMVTSPTDPITDLLIAKAIKFNILQDFNYFENLFKVNWDMATRLLQHDLLANQLKDKWSAIKALPYYWLRDRYGLNQPEKKLISLNRLQYLDLATHSAAPKKSHTEFDFTMKKTLSEEEKIKQQIAADFLTTRDYFFEMMFGKNGYYTTGKIAFSKDTKESISKTDFRTTASNVKSRGSFAAIFAHQLLQFRKQMIAKDPTKKKAPFNVLECGAGDGDLCAAIFAAIQKMAATGDPEWQEFYDCFHYHILEKSPALLERQKENTAAYSAKITYLQGDAMQLEKNGRRQYGGGYV